MDAHANTDTTDRARILVPLDGSPLSEVALPLAARVARSEGGSIHLTRVHVPLIAEAYLGFPVDEWEDESRANDAKYLAAVAQRVLAEQGMQAETELLEGPVGRAIADHARKIGASLIVITTHGRTGLSRAWLGSTADWLARYAPAPVLLVRPPEQGAAPMDTTVRHVLVPLDGSERSEKILPDAIRLAKGSGAHMTLVRVVRPVFRGPAPFGGPGFPLMPDEASTMEALRHAKDYVDDVAARLRREPGTLELHTEVLADERAADAIIECARNSSANVIALSTRGRGASRLLVGSVADKVLRGFTGATLVLGPVAAHEIEEGARANTESALVEA